MLNVIFVNKDTFLYFDHFLIYTLVPLDFVMKFLKGKN